ncbi:MAG: DUF4878 domain-containing protein [Ginsengibacter sp.]
MKKIVTIAVAAFVIILSGCQSAGSGSPKDVLHDFFTALSKKDFDGAKKYATKDSDGMISMMEMGMKNMQQGNSGHADKMLDMINNMKMGDPVITGDNATITVTDTKSSEATDFLLKKEDGKWKVAFDMSTLMEMANKKDKEHGMEGMDSTQQNMPQVPAMPDSTK